MATYLEKINEAVRAHIDGDEVTQQEYDDYLEVVEEAHGLLLDKWLFKWPQFEREFREWLETAQNYYYRFDIFIGVATYKKLVPDQDRRDMKSLYWSLWALEASLIAGLVLDDLVDETPQRYGEPTVHEKVGAGSAICMAVYVMLVVGEILDEKLPENERSAALRSVLRGYGKDLLNAVVVDSPAKSRQDRQSKLSWDWFNMRAKYCCDSVMWYPVQAAFALAGKPTDSESGTIVRELIKILGLLARASDDVGDCQVDAENRVIAWTTMIGLGLNKQLIEDHYVNKVDGTLEEVIKLYAGMDLNQRFQELEEKQRSKYFQILDGASEEVPKVAWKTLYEFASSYVLSIWHD